MIASEINLKSRQVVLIHDVLGKASGASGDRFCVAGVLRRIQNLGDWDPEFRMFRLLGPTEHEVHSEDGKVVVSPEGTPAKGYRYSDAALGAPFPTIKISPEERGAVVRALSNLVGHKDNNCAGVSILLDIAEWLGLGDDLTNLVQPQNPGKGAI